MKDNKLSELSIQEITKQKKLLTGVLIGFSIVLVIAYSILIYLMIRHKNYIILTIIPLGFVTLLPAIIRLSQINAEIKSRSEHKG